MNRAFSGTPSTELIHATGKTDTKIIPRQGSKQGRNFGNLELPSGPASFQPAMAKSLTYQRQPYQGEPLPNYLNVDYGSSLGGNLSTQHTVMIPSEIDLASYSGGRRDVPQAQITNEPLDSPQLLSQDLQSPDVPFTWDLSFDEFCSSPLDVDEFVNSPTNDSSFPTSTWDNASLSLPTTTSSSQNAVYNLFFNSAQSNVFPTDAGTSTFSAVPTFFASPLRAHCPSVSPNIILQLHPWIPRQVDPPDAGPGNIGMSKTKKVAGTELSKIVHRFKTILPRGSEAVFDHNPKVRIISLQQIPRQRAVTRGVTKKEEIIQDMVRRRNVFQTTTISAIPRSLQLIKRRHSFLVPNSAESSSWSLTSYGIDMAFLLAILDWINNEVEKNKATMAASLGELRECVEADLLRLLENCKHSTWRPRASRALAELKQRWRAITIGDLPQALFKVHGQPLYKYQLDSSLVREVLNSLGSRNGSAAVSSSSESAVAAVLSGPSKILNPGHYHPSLDEVGTAFYVKYWNGTKIAKDKFLHLRMTKPGAYCLAVLKLINCHAEVNPLGTLAGVFDKLRMRVDNELHQIEKHHANRMSSRSTYKSILSRHKVLDKQWNLLRYGTQTTAQGVKPFQRQ